MQRRKLSVLLGVLLSAAVRAQDDMLREHHERLIDCSICAAIIENLASEPVSAQSLDDSLERACVRTRKGFGRRCDGISSKLKTPLARMLPLDFAAPALGEICFRSRLCKRPQQIYSPPQLRRHPTIFDHYASVVHSV